MNKPDYESMTVFELKELTEKRGIEILSDARKPEIIAALEASDLLLHPPEEEVVEPKDAATPPKGRASPEERGNTYEYNMTSTTTALMTAEDYERLKLSA